MGGREEGQDLGGVVRVVEEEQHAAVGEGGPPERGAALGVVGYAFGGCADRAQQAVEGGRRGDGALAGGESLEVYVELAVGEEVGDLAGCAHGEGGLAAAAHAVDGDHGGVLRGRVRRVGIHRRARRVRRIVLSVDAGEEGGEVLAAAREVGEIVGEGAGGGGRGGSRGGV